MRKVTVLVLFLMFLTGHSARAFTSSAGYFPASSSASSATSGSYSVPSTTGTFKIIYDVTCPPPPRIPAGVCKPVCPSGYKPLADANSADIQSTGVYICIKENSGGSYSTSYTTFGGSGGGNFTVNIMNTCTYVNPYCKGYAPTQREAVKKLVLGEVSNALNLPSSDTYIKKLLRLATFDPSYASEIETKSTSAIYLFFYDTFKEIARYANRLAFIYFAFMSVWLGMYLGIGGGLLKEVTSGYKLSLIRALFGLTFFLVPIPTKTGTGSYAYQPAIARAVAKCVYMGNDFADKLAQKLNGIFMTQMLTYSANHLSVLSNSLKEKMQGELRTINMLETKVKLCEKLYGGADLLVPDDILGNIPYQGTPAIENQIKSYGLNPETFSRVSCREWIRNYKQTLATYNRQVSFLNSVNAAALTTITPTEIKQILTHPSTFKPTATTDKKKQLLQELKYVSLYQKKLGWISYPLITLPVFQFTLSELEAADNISLKIEEPSVFAKAIGFLSFPPGSMVLKTVKDALNGMAKLMGAIVKLLPFGGVFTKILSFATGGKFESIVSAVNTVGALFLAYLITKVLLNLLPMMVLIVAITFKIIGYVIDVFKITVVSPFISVQALSVRRYDNVYRFLARVFALMVEPIILIVASFIGFFAMYLSKYMLYTLPVSIITALNDMGIGLSLSFITTPVLEGVFYYISIVASAFLVYKVIMNSTDVFFHLFGLEIARGGGEHAKEMTESVARRIGTPL